MALSFPSAALSALLAAPVAARATAPGDRWEGLLASAKALDASGRSAEAEALYDKAEPLLRRALMLNPRDYRLYVSLARLYRRRDRPQQAGEVLRVADKACPRCSELFIQAGYAAANQGEGASTLELFTKAQKDDPGSPEPYIHLAYFFERQGKVADAEEAYARAIELSIASDTRHLSHASSHLAAFYRRQGRTIEAENAYRKAIEAFSRRGNVLGMVQLTVRLAMFEADRGRLPEARSLLEALRRGQVLEGEPEAIVSTAEAYLLWRAGSIDDTAFNTLQRSAYRDSKTVLNVAAKFYKDTNRLPRAEELWERILKRDETESYDYSTYTLVTLAQIKEALGKHRTAKDLAERALPVLEGTVQYDEAADALTVLLSACRVLGDAAGAKAAKQRMTLLETSRRDRTPLALGKGP